MPKPTTITMNITGGPELARALRELGDLTSDRRAITAIKDGMVQASQPMADVANKLAPTDAAGPDVIRVVASKSLTARQRKEARRESKGRILTYVGDVGRVGVLHEFGTVERFQRDAAGVAHKSVGRITPTPFMRPAFDSTAKQVIDRIVPHVRAVVEKRAKAAAKRNARKAAK